MSRFILSALLVLSAVACTEVVPSGGTGGSGGGAGTGGTAGTGGSGGNGGMGGDAFVCDDGTGSGGDSTACNACLGCAATDPCSRETERCDGSSACTAFSECLNACGETGGDFDMCVDGCVSSDPEGASIFEIAQNCQFCECPTNCASFDNCRDVLECDDGTIPSPDEPEVCNACTTCAAEGPCQASTAACDSSTECSEFSDCDIECLNGGGDEESCFMTCSETHPAGAVLYRDNATCLCAQCPDNCSDIPACDFY